MSKQNLMPIFRFTSLFLAAFYIFFNGNIKLGDLNCTKLIESVKRGKKERIEKKGRKTEKNELKTYKY